MKQSYHQRWCHERTRLAHTSTNSRAKKRMAGALKRLQRQLDAGVRFPLRASQPLSEKDVNRINTEIITLEERTK